MLTRLALNPLCRPNRILSSSAFRLFSDDQNKSVIHIPHNSQSTEIIGQSSEIQGIFRNIYVDGIPAFWEEGEIKQKMDKYGKIVGVKRILNKLGESTGNAILTYTSENEAKEAISQIEGRIIHSYLVKARPFIGKEERDYREAQLCRRVKISNIPYDLYEKDLRQLVEQFGKIEEIIFVKDRNGLPKGYAFAIMSTIKDAIRVVKYCNMRHIKERKLLFQMHEDQLNFKEAQMKMFEKLLQSKKLGIKDTREENLVNQDEEYAKFLGTKMEVNALINQADPERNENEKAIIAQIGREAGYAAHENATLAEIIQNEEQFEKKAFQFLSGSKTMKGHSTTFVQKYLRTKKLAEVNKKSYMNEINEFKSKFPHLYAASTEYMKFLKHSGVSDHEIFGKEPIKQYYTKIKDPEAKKMGIDIDVL